jgi:guanylate kinase
MSKSINNEPVIIASKEFSNCKMKHCRPDDKTVADNYKYQLEHFACVDKALKLPSKQQEKKFKECDKDKWTIEYEKALKCIKSKCGKEQKRTHKLTSELVGLQLDLMKKFATCSDVKCAELTNEKNAIFDKCKDYKSYKKRMSCRDKDNFEDVRLKLSKCKKKECAELHKELSVYNKKFDKIFTKIDNEIAKINKKNKLIYEKYYPSAASNNKKTTIKKQQKSIKPKTTKSIKPKTKKLSSNK